MNFKAFKSITCCILQMILEAYFLKKYTYITENKLTKIKCLFCFPAIRTLYQFFNGLRWLFSFGELDHTPFPFVVITVNLMSRCKVIRESAVNLLYELVNFVL